MSITMYFLEYSAGYGNYGSYNVFLGKGTGKASTGSYNSFVGFQAGMKNTTGTYNDILGHEAGYSNQSVREKCFLSGFQRPEEAQQGQVM
ncbi:MAG: hypothetical protein U5L72_01615 [Bacteroidales bacterium]|nr:hypothetical protein [Bacteroidales bacterium]